MASEKKSSQQSQKSSGQKNFDQRTDALLAAGVPGRFAVSVLNHFGDKYENLTWDRCGYFISGIPGIGKTHLAAAMCRDRLRPDHPATIAPLSSHEDREGEFKIYTIHPMALGWIAVPRLLSTIRETFKNRDPKKESELDIVKRFCAYTLLVLDDLGAEKVTDWSASTLYDLISHREAHMMDTVITSNMDIDDIAEWEPRIASRLSGMGRINLEGEDRRG